jgi:NADH-quinone oxidoreductase subunit E
MSVRRLAEVSVQPPAFAFAPAFSAQADVWIAKFPEGRQQSAVIPLLMLAQEQEGWISKAAIEGIADMLRMPRIRALEVATFYTQFQLKPVGSRAHIQVCGTTPCMLRGSEALMDVCRSKIHHDQFHLNAAGTLSWEEVECLGACVNAPMVMIFKDAYEDLTPERLGEIIDAFEEGRGETVPTGPQNGRTVSIPTSGQTTLLDEQVFIDAAKRRKETESAAAQDGAGNVDVPPSYAAKPSTSAPETSPVMKSPAPAKEGGAAEGVRGSEAPSHDEKEADRPDPAKQGAEAERDRPRRGAEPAAFVAPEYASKPKAAESGQVTATARTSVSPMGSPSGPAGVPAGAADAPPTVAPPPVAPAAGVDALGSAMGGSVSPKGAGASGAAATAVHSGGSNVVDVSDSNTPRPGDDQLRAQGSAAGQAAQGEIGVSLTDPDRPSGMPAPETPDDLKLISGIGPKIEKTLNELGIYTFGQIAGWSERERKWVDGYLRFHGRIERDNWRAQAEALATGGEEEYFRVFGRRPR